MELELSTFEDEGSTFPRNVQIHLYTDETPHPLRTDSQFTSAAETLYVRRQIQHLRCNCKQHLSNTYLRHMKMPA